MIIEICLHPQMDSGFGMAAKITGILRKASDEVYFLKFFPLIMM
ncbi:MAG: hypothetical protein NTY50_00450 [Methylobacter sp.]|nr:hypothetical protein [Methylobacter sp.]